MIVIEYVAPSLLCRSFVVALARPIHVLTGPPPFLDERPREMGPAGDDGARCDRKCDGVRVRQLESGRDGAA